MSSPGKTKDDDDRRGARPRGLTELFAQVSSDERLVPPGRYCAYNAFLGVIVLAFAVVMLVEPGHVSRASAVALAVFGALMESGLVAALVRPVAVERVLAAQGAAAVAMALFLAAGSLAWALSAPAHAPFRYLPGLTLGLLVYGALQIAAFGPWRARARRVRMSGIVVGLACEMALAAALLLRALRS